MRVYVIDYTLTMEENQDACVFQSIIKEQLTKYGVENYHILESNISIYKQKLNNESLIVVFVDNNYVISDIVQKFIESAMSCNVDIWPVALDRDNRVPCDMISKCQSFDVWEQLRCRDLGKEYLSVVAKVFSKKIVARVMPTLYSEEGLIFVSHRRLDGELITAELCDNIIQQSKRANIFRDIVNVEVGEEAQSVIDSAMQISHAFIFIHTHQSSKSEWIQKELRYAVLRNIPILWIQIDNADTSELKILPNEKPHLKYSSSDFYSKERCSQIADEILQETFELIMSRSSRVFDYLESLNMLFNDDIKEENEREMMYSVSVPRKNYHYPQRNIKQYIQLFGRTIDENDIDAVQALLTQEDNYDSIALISNKVLSAKRMGEIVVESMDDYYYNWKKYLTGERANKGKEIVISGAFPDSDEAYKQCLTDAIVIFAKSILKEGYSLTFGSHPTFQEIFFEVANEVYPERSKEMLKMYISKWFEERYSANREFYSERAQLNEIERGMTIEGSLTLMRTSMIKRKEVAALVCLGGKVKSDRSQEGIREEIEIAKEYGIPVFVVGSVGGCSAEVAKEMEKASWQGINDAPKELNGMFMESVDYFTLSNEMFLYLNYKSLEVQPKVDIVY